MREYTSKVDKLEEAENLRVTEAKETEYKPVVMGKCCIPPPQVPTKGVKMKVVVWVSLGCG